MRCLYLNRKSSVFHPFFDRVLCILSVEKRVGLGAAGVVVEIAAEGVACRQAVTRIKEAAFVAKLVVCESAELDAAEDRAALAFLSVAIGVVILVLLF